MGQVSDIEKLYHEHMLSWVSYPYSGNSCYAYPQYLVKGGRISKIDSLSAFPRKGSVGVTVRGGKQAPELKQEYGEIVVTKINKPSLLPNDYYDGMGEGGSLGAENRYHTDFYPSQPLGQSPIEIVRLSASPLSDSLVQVVELADGSVPFDRQPKGKLELAPGSALPQTTMVLVERQVGAQLMYYGPFDYTLDDEGNIALDAPGEFQRRLMEVGVGELPEVANLNDMVPHGGGTIAKFVEKGELVAMFKRKSYGRLLDWVTDEDLIDAVGRIMASSSELADLGKDRIRAIKAAVRACNSAEAGMLVDDARRERIARLIENPGSWAKMGDQFKRALLDPEVSARFVELASSPEYFEAVRPALMDDEKIKRRVDEERERLESSIGALERQEESLRDQVDLAIERLNDADWEFDKIRHQALQDSEDELRALEALCEEKRDELEAIEERRAAAEAEYRELDKRVGEVFDRISNSEAEISGKIIESEMLRRVVASVSAAGASGGKGSPSLAPSEMRDEGGMGAREVVDAVHEGLSARSGREMSRNEAVNLVTCLMQGYVTVLAGAPGTGKTSLCEILAGSLGLLADGSPARYVEVCVERGWSSYRDFVGFYNPLSKTVEKTNPAVFDAMAELYAEGSSRKRPADSMPPFLFLLDEANLSPIEHYWAPFLRSCDSFRTGTRLSLGGDEELLIPETMRFLATLNVDHTTEALSPRFLDRSWVIVLEPKAMDLEDMLKQAQGDYGSTLPFSYRKLMDVFAPEGAEIEDAQERVFKKFINTCSKGGVQVSPRSQVMMARYIAAAGRLMDTASRDSQYAPVDFAIAQKALPSMTGSVERVGPLMERLSEEFGSLPLTKRHVDRMIASAGDHGYYQFF